MLYAYELRVLSEKKILGCAANAFYVNNSGTINKNL
jgi:hypothetical protein